VILNELKKAFLQKRFLSNIPSTKKIDFIKIDDILYFESDGRYTIIHLMDQTTFFVSKNIGEYDKILAPNYFFRIHYKH
jgi:two-component system LytT family response regulator